MDDQTTTVPQASADAATVDGAIERLNRVLAPTGSAMVPMDQVLDAGLEVTRPVVLVGVDGERIVVQASPGLVSLTVVGGDGTVHLPLSTAAELLSAMIELVAAELPDVAAEYVARLTEAGAAELDRLRADATVESVKRMREALLRSIVVTQGLRQDLIRARVKAAMPSPDDELPAPFLKALVEKHGPKLVAITAKKPATTKRVVALMGVNGGVAMWPGVRTALRDGGYRVEEVPMSESFGVRITRGRYAGSDA